MPPVARNPSPELRDGADCCERFDVLRPAGSDNRVLLYEIYQDREAFDLHATSAHYLAFAAATHALIRHKVVTVCDRVADRFPAGAYGDAVTSRHIVTTGNDS